MKTEWGFNGSCVLPTNPKGVQTGWVSKYLMKTRLSLQFIQTPVSVYCHCQYQNSEYDSSTSGQSCKIFDSFSILLLRITNKKCNFNYKKCRSNMNTPVVFLTVQFCDSKEPKKIAVYYMRRGKTKQSNTQRKRKISQTIAAFNNLLFFCFSQHLRMLCPISVVHLEKPMNNQEPKRDNNPTRLVVTLCSEKQKQFSTSLYSTQTFNTWLQRFPSSFSSISLITFLNRFTCLPSIVVSSISFHTSNDYMNMLN